MSGHAEQVRRVEAVLRRCFGGDLTDKECEQLVDELIEAVEAGD